MWQGLSLVLAPAAAAGAYLFGKWTESRRAGRKDVLAEWQSYVSHQAAQIERQQAVIDQHGRAVEALAAENADCREESAELRQGIFFLHDHLARCFGCLKSMGHDQGELPALPPPRPRRDVAAAGAFLARQAQQSAELVKGAGAAVTPPAAGPT